MHTVRIFVCLLILYVAENHGRAIRQRRQAISNQFRQDVGNLWSNTYNSIRDNVVPAIGSTVDRFSQNWDRYKQNINQGFNQMGQTWDRYKQNMNQGWNQFRQDYFQQYPTYNSGYNNNPYGYYAPPNTYQNYDNQRNNFVGPNWYGQSRVNYQNSMSQQQQPMYFNAPQQGSMNYGNNPYGVLLNANQGSGRRRRRR